MTKYVTYRYTPSKENGSIDEMMQTFDKLKQQTYEIIYDDNGKPKYIEHRTNRGPGTTHWNSLTES